MHKKKRKKNQVKKQSIEQPESSIAEVSNIQPSILDMIKNHDPQVLNGIPDEKIQRIENALQIVSIQTSFTGPLPPPSLLKEFNEAIPDGANRIMIMAENQSDHRIDVEKIVITSQQKQSARGQIFGFIICLLGMLLALIMILKDNIAMASVFFGVDLLAMVSLFVIGKSVQRKDLVQKDKANL